MLEPASSSESTKQSGGISVTESRLSHSSFLSLSWLFSLVTGSSFSACSWICLMNRTSSCSWICQMSKTLSFPVSSSQGFYSRMSPRILSNIAEYVRKSFISLSGPLEIKTLFNQEDLDSAIWSSLKNLNSDEIALCKTLYSWSLISLRHHHEVHICRFWVQCQLLEGLP